MQIEDIEIGSLYDEFLDKGYLVIRHSDDYEVIDITKENIKIHTVGNVYKQINFLSRHKTSKNLIEITTETGNSVIVTTDHVCMRYNRDHFLESTNAKNLSVGDTALIYDKKTDKELLADICKIKDLGKTDDYVYDLEVEDDRHCFYGNNILLHNSQFVNLQCITDHLKKTHNIEGDLQDWSEENKRLLWDTVEDFVNNDVNKYVRNLVHDFCHTNEQNVLTYELEYMGDVGIYESKKHYAVHKIFEEGDRVDKIKFSGIELKKAQVPKEMKKFLADIYDGVLLKKWDEKTYNDYVNDLYDKFKNFTIDEVSFWKGYNTERQAVGFLQMQLGTTGIAKAAVYCNHLIQKLGIAKKYEEIKVGDKVRFCYLEPNNPYKIDCIAYKPGFYPEEFKKLFRIDYKKMFEKIILDSLKRFREACKFKDSDPSKQVLQDIFDF